MFDAAIILNVSSVVTCKYLLPVFVGNRMWSFVDADHAQQTCVSDVFPQFESRRSNLNQRQVGVYFADVSLLKEHKEHERG